MISTWSPGGTYTVAFNEIAEVAAPYAGQPYFTVRFHTRTTAIGVIAGSEHAVRYALWRLSQGCRLTDRAAARIHA